MPKYLELVNWIRKQIEDGELSPGEKLYSENELSDMFSLSRQTVRHAISVLEQEGVLNRVQGSGTYINEPRSKRPDTGRIAVIMTYTDGYIFPRTIRAIEDKLFKAGYLVQLAVTNNLISREGAILETILEQDDVEGIIVETVKSALPNPNLHLYQELLARQIPVLFINSYYPELSAPHVSMDDRLAGRLVTEYLLKKGHKKIAGVFKLDDGQGHLRYAGFLEALEAAGIACDESKIIWVDTEDTKDFEKLREKVRCRTRGCTGLVCYNDEIAFGLLKILKEEGIRVPENLSIVSVDNTDLAVLGDVMLTSMPYPMEKLGECAAEKLMKMIKNSGFDGNYEFPMQIVERDSVKDLNKNK